MTAVRCVVNESAYYRSRNETTHSNSFISRLRHSIFGNKEFNRGDATGQNQLAEQSSEEDESSSETSTTTSQTCSSSRRRSTVSSRPSTLSPGPTSGIGRRPTSRSPFPEDGSSQEQDPRGRPTRSRRSTLSSTHHHGTGRRPTSRGPLLEEDPSVTLLGSQGPPISSSPDPSPPRGRSTRSRRPSLASNDPRPVSIIPLGEDGLAALRYAGEIGPPRSHQALSPGRSVSSERSVHAPLLPRRSSSRASRRYLDRF